MHLTVCLGAKDVSGPAFLLDQPACVCTSCVQEHKIIRWVLTVVL